MRLCVKCNQLKSESEYHVYRRDKDGLRKWCKACDKIYKSSEHYKKWRDNWRKTPKRVRWHLNWKCKTRYGITADEFDALSKTQGGRCAICNREAKLVIDHNHDSGKVRGLLCNQCNVGIAQFKENPQFMVEEIDYLTTWESWEWA